MDNMVPYNTNMKPLRLPEYGRNVQQMVDFCLTIEDRDERTRCAYSIVDVMKNLFPEVVGDKGDKHTLWDHLNIMADFKLDIDFPCEVLSEENLNPKPAKIPYGGTRIKYKHYGKDVESMIHKIADMEDGAEKDDLINMIANHMKKLMVINNKEGVDDRRIFKDLYEYSDGKINLNPATYVLHEFKAEVTPAPSKNNGKKKKK